MICVTVELWLWMGEELGGDFMSISEMRSGLDISVENGTTIRGLFDRLAGHYGAIHERIFDRDKQKFSGNVVVTLNDRVTNPHNVYEKSLEDSDKVTVLPVYAGG